MPPLYEQAVCVKRAERKTHSQIEDSIYSKYTMCMLIVLKKKLCPSLEGSDLLHLALSIADI